MMHFKLSNPVTAFLFFVLIAILPMGFAQAQLVGGGCGSLENGYGPYDARTDHAKLPIVMVYHFTPAIENLIEGTTNTPVASELDYTLRAIPNYHRALIAMMRLGERQKKETLKGARYPVECWFQRAIAFRADDAIVRMIYSTYLNKKKRLADANLQLDTAAVYAKDNAFTHYNIGLHYFDLNNYDKALVQAHKAISLGSTLTELKGQLVSVNKWIEPVEKPVSSEPGAGEPVGLSK